MLNLARKITHLFTSNLLCFVFLEHYSREGDAVQGKTLKRIALSEVVVYNKTIRSLGVLKIKKSWKGRE